MQAASVSSNGIGCLVPTFGFVLALDLSAFMSPSRGVAPLPLEMLLAYKKKKKKNQKIPHDSVGATVKSQRSGSRLGPQSISLFCFFLPLRGSYKEPGPLWSAKAQGRSLSSQVM